MVFLLYPLYLISFWYIDVTKVFVTFFISFNRYLASLLSLPLLIKTFFRPLKNEYREGLVLFSIVMGIIVKTFIIIASTLFISVVLITEVFVVLFILVLPPLVFSLLFIGGSIL